MKTNFTLSVVAFFVCGSSLATDYEQYHQDMILQNMPQDMPQGMRDFIEKQIKPPENKADNQSDIKLNKILESEKKFSENYATFDVAGFRLGDDIKTIIDKLSNRFPYQKAEYGIQGFGCGNLANNDFELQVLGDERLPLYLKKEKPDACYGQRRVEDEDEDIITRIQTPEKIYISLNPEFNAYEIHYSATFQLGHDKEGCEKGVADKIDDMIKKFGDPFIRKSTFNGAWEIGWGFAYDNAGGNFTFNERSQIESLGFGKTMPNMDSDLRLRGSGYVAKFSCRDGISTDNGKADVKVTLFHRELEEQGKVKPLIEKADF